VTYTRRKDEPMQIMRFYKPTKETLQDFMKSREITVQCREPTKHEPLAWYIREEDQVPFRYDKPMPHKRGGLHVWYPGNNPPTPPKGTPEDWLKEAGVRWYYAVFYSPFVTVIPKCKDKATVIRMATGFSPDDKPHNVIPLYLVPTGDLVRPQDVWAWTQKYGKGLL